MSETFSRLDVISTISDACAMEGGQKAWAQKHGLSPQYVSDVIAERRLPGKSILAAAGFVKAELYYAKDPTP